MRTFGNKIVRIISANSEEFTVKIQFSDRSKGTISLKHIFKQPKGLAAEILKGNLFLSCFIESGALAWPNGFELCADALRIWMEEQKRKIAA